MYDLILMEIRLCVSIVPTARFSNMVPFKPLVMIEAAIYIHYTTFTPHIYMYNIIYIYIVAIRIDEM